MSLTEQQLQTWANPGAISSPATTYSSIKAAIDQYQWPDDMIIQEPYLQGSYANSTNVRANSDIDVVVQLGEDIFYSNLTEDEKRKMGLSVGKYKASDVRQETITALTNYYGAGLVDTSGKNSIKVKAASGRLNADVVPCVTYKEYSSGTINAKGISFWNSAGDQVINYPKLHIDAGESKNSVRRTSGQYKPAVRMFKNAKDAISPPSMARSYFIECLMFNVPDNSFAPSYRDTFYNCIQFLHGSFKTNSSSQFMTQSGRQWLFGSSCYEWDQQAAKDLVNGWIALWNQ